MNIEVKSTFMLANSIMAAFAAEDATLGSTTDARNATVDIIGLPAFEKGIGWYVKGPTAPPVQQILPLD